MELEEAKKICQDFIDENKSRRIILHTAIETILQALEDLIPKKKIEKIIKEELPDDEICAICKIYAVNGVKIKQKLEELLEEK